MTRPSPEPPDAVVQPPPVSATRRDVLLAGGAASAALLVLGAGDGASAPAAVLNGPERGQPFDDGTYFDDGYGWVD
jgi:hypothetical protein